MLQVARLAPKLLGDSTDLVADFLHRQVNPTFAARLAGRNNAAIMLVRFSRDGTRLATGSADGWIRVWDTAQLATAAHKQPIYERRAHPHSITAVETYEGAEGSFAKLWNYLHAKPGTRWEDNPEVYAIRFTAHHRNIDEPVEKAA